VLRKNAKIELLRRVPLFSGCSKQELAQIAGLADEVDVPAGKALMREGERGREFVVVLEGDVEVRKGGRKLPVRGGSEFFGEIALVSDTPRTATVTTTSPVRALVITDRDFRSLLRDSPQIQLKVLTALAERLAPETT
jgi:CRP-like cAMP-binding protein